MEKDYLGLGKRPAQNLAEKNGLIFRLVSVDGKDVLSEPTDVVKDRICVWIEQGKVTKFVFT